MSKNYFLYASTPLLGLMMQSALCMNDIDDLSEGSLLRRESSNLSFKIQAHILSFLDLPDLLKAGGISKNGWQNIETIGKNKSLDLSNRKLSQEDYEALAQGPFYSLILRDVQLGPKEIGILALSSRLKHLDVRDNRIGAEGAKVRAFMNLSTLTTLNLSYNRIGDEGTKSIAIANFPFLTALDLHFNNIKNEGAKAIAAANFPLLTLLDLHFNSIEDEGAENLANAHFPLLTVLNLRSNLIGDKGLKGIVTAKFSLLTTLDLRSNLIRDERAGNVAIAHFPLLKKLYLRFNIEDEGKKASAKKIKDVLDHSALSH